MGPYRTQKALILALCMAATPVAAQQPGWHYSPLPGEGDRAALGCDRHATQDDFVCLAVRCEDDFTTGVHVHTSRPGKLGLWEMTLDRENASLATEPSGAPYGGQFIKDADWLLERIEQGTFVYLRHADDEAGSFAYIDLTGSLRAINRALAYCAPRVPAPSEPNDGAGV
jgi:hypothetical protein